jgi:hypothetical protein
VPAQNRLAGKFPWRKRLDDHPYRATTSPRLTRRHGADAPANAPNPFSNRNRSTMKATDFAYLQEQEAHDPQID